MNYEQSWNNLKKAFQIYPVEVEMKDIRSDEMADLIVNVMTYMEKSSNEDDPEYIVRLFCGWI